MRDPAVGAGAAAPPQQSEARARSLPAASAAPCHHAALAAAPRGGAGGAGAERCERPQASGHHGRPGLAKLSLGLARGLKPISRPAARRGAPGEPRLTSFGAPARSSARCNTGIAHADCVQAPVGHAPTRSPTRRHPPPPAPRSSVADAQPNVRRTYVAPPLQARTVSGFQPEGVHLTQWTTDSVLVSWQTGGAPLERLYNRDCAACC